MDKPPREVTQDSLTAFQAGKPVPDDVKSQTFELDAEDMPVAPRGPEVLEGMNEFGEGSSGNPNKKADQKIEMDPEKGKLNVNDKENLITKGENETSTEKGGQTKETSEARTEKETTSGETKPELRTELGKPTKASIARDYTQFPPEVAEALKNTPNKVYDTIKAYATGLKEKEAKYAEIEAKLPNMVEKSKLDEAGTPLDWYNHPNAYTLHPDFIAAHNDYSAAQGELRHFQNQLAAIEGGSDKWFNIRGYGKDGRPVYEEMETSPVHKANIISAMQQLHQITAQKGAEVNQIAQNFQARYTKATQYVEEVANKQFPWHKDEKAPEQKYVQNYMKWVPQEFANHPMAKGAAFLYAALQKTLDYVEELQKKEAKGVTVKEEKDKLEPSLNSPTISSTGGRTASSNGGTNKWGGRMNVPETLVIESEED